MFYNKPFLKILSLTTFTGLITSITLLAVGCERANSNSVLSELDSIPDCSFFELELPKNAVVYGLHTDKSVILPYIIDDTNQAAREIDLVVNSPQQPVVLFLATYNPSIWDIQWTAGTKILGVVAFGHHTQAVAGLPKETPILTNTYEDCSEEITFYSYLAGKPFYTSTVDEKFTLEEFSTKLFGQPSNNYTFHSQSYSPNESIYFFGEPPEEDTALLSSDDTPVESFFVTAPRMGTLGIKDALEKGTLKEATKEDYVNWVEANIRAKQQAYGDKWSTAEQQAYRAKLMSHYPEYTDAYVVLKDFTFPPESRGVFFIPEGVPLPKRDPSGSSIYALDTGKCFNYCPGFPYGDITVLDYPEHD